MKPSEFTYRVDYANGQQLGAVEKFTRGSTALGVNSMGDLVSHAIDVPCFDFDAATLACNGLLSEPTSTNVLTYSEAPNGLSDFQSLMGNVSATTFPGFAGGVAYAGQAESQWAYKNYVTPQGTFWCFSVFVRMDDGSAPTIVSQSGPHPGNDFALIMYNLASTGELPTVNDMGGGLYRISMTAARPRDGSGGSNQFSLFGVCRYNTNRARPFRVTGFQLEQVSGHLVNTNGVTSYIPTQASAVTRSATSVSIPTNNLFKIIRADQGVMHARAVVGGFRGVNQVLMSLSDGTVANRIVLYRNNFLQLCALCLIDNSSIFNTPITGSLVPGQIADVAISFSRGRWLASGNGVGVTLSTSTSMPIVNVLHVGQGLNFIPWQGHIQAWETNARPISLAEITELTKWP